jgi:hypothetical protein
MQKDIFIQLMHTHRAIESMRRLNMCHIKLDTHEYVEGVLSGIRMAMGLAAGKTNVVMMEVEKIKIKYEDEIAEYNQFLEDTAKMAGIEYPEDYLDAI